MDLRGISLSDFEAICVRISEDRYDGNVKTDLRDISSSRTQAIRGRVLVKASHGSGARRSSSGRRMPAACWHLTRDVLAAAFDLNPSLKVRTAIARYDGKEGFYSTFPETAYHNVGSIVQPAYMPNLCDCDSMIQNHVYNLDVYRLRAGLDN